MTGFSLWRSWKTSNKLNRRWICSAGRGCWFPAPMCGTVAAPGCNIDFCSCSSPKTLTLPNSFLCSKISRFHHVCVFGAISSVKQIKGRKIDPEGSLRDSRRHVSIQIRALKVWWQGSLFATTKNVQYFGTFCIHSFVLILTAKRSASK